MSPRFVLERENVPCVAEVVNRLLKADCTDFTFELFEIDKMLFIAFSVKLRLKKTSLQAGIFVLVILLAGKKQK